MPVGCCYFHNRGVLRPHRRRLSRSAADISGPRRSLPPYVGLCRTSMAWSGPTTRACANRLLRSSPGTYRPAADEPGRAPRRPDSREMFPGSGRTTRTSFTRYAFGTLRQCGAWAETGAVFVSWFDPALTPSIENVHRCLRWRRRRASSTLCVVAAGRDPSTCIALRLDGRTTGTGATALCSSAHG